jgi:hypothetical protein
MSQRLIKVPKNTLTALATRFLQGHKWGPQTEGRPHGIYHFLAIFKKGWQITFFIDQESILLELARFGNYLFVIMKLRDQSNQHFALFDQIFSRSFGNLRSKS